MLAGGTHIRAAGMLRLLHALSQLLKRSQLLCHLPLLLSIVLSAIQWAVRMHPVSCWPWTSFMRHGEDLWSEGPQAAAQLKPGLGEPELLLLHPQAVVDQTGLGIGPGAIVGVGGGSPASCHEVTGMRALPGGPHPVLHPSSGPCPPSVAEVLRGNICQGGKPAARSVREDRSRPSPPTPALP